MSNLDEQFKSIWRQQSAPPIELSLSELRRRAHYFHARIRIRNAMEYGAAAVVVFLFGREGLMHLDRPIFASACGLIIFAALWITYYLRKNGRASKPPIDSDSKAYLIFVADDLRRHYALMRNIWWWYLGPFVPGMVLYLTFHPERHSKITLVNGVLIFSTFFAAAHLWNRFFARGLRQGIEQVETILRELEGEHAATQRRVP